MAPNYNDLDRDIDYINTYTTRAVRSHSTVIVINWTHALANYVDSDRHRVTLILTVIGETNSFLNGIRYRVVSRLLKWYRN